MLHLRTASGLHTAGIHRTAAAFGGYPVDVLGRVLDVAGFAVDAVLRIDLQLWIAGVGAGDFVDSGWAVAGFRTAVLVPVDADRQAGIAKFQMGRLVFLMIGV